jgi:hypothetical protein
MLQVGRKARRVRGNSSLARKVVEQTQIGRAEGFARRARREEQRTDRFVLIEKGDRDEG